MQKDRYIDIDRQINIQIVDRQIERQEDRQIERQKDRQVYRYSQIDRQQRRRNIMCNKSGFVEITLRALFYNLSIKDVSYLLLVGLTIEYRFIL